jgi:glyoxylase-like metal-dependent hydrolase (beta-lactamase superfamily II)
MLVTIDTEYVRPQAAAVYLRVDAGEAAFIETNTVHALPRLLEALEEHRLSPDDVRYVIVTHAHLDHASGASAVLAACPNAMLVCHPRAKRNLVDPSRLVASAVRVYGAEAFAALYGTIAPVAEARVREVADGEALALGKASLRFLHTAGHAKHHFVVHDEAHDTVFTGDAFGLVFPALQRAGRFAFPSTSPIDFDAQEAHASIGRILALQTRSVCLTHFGEYEDKERIADQLRRWIDSSQAAVEECVLAGRVEAETFLRERLAQQFEHRASEVGLVLGPEEKAILEMDLTLNAQGLAFVVGRRLAPS